MRNDPLARCRARDAAIVRLLVISLQLVPFLLALASPPVARAMAAAEQPPSELKRLPIEELLQVEVTSPTKRPESVARTAATISVLTHQQIVRSGARTLADALRYAAGLHVARFDSRSWSISARGMNAQTSNKMLVLIDGRTVYTPLFSGVFWDVQVPMLADIERIEVVRGPAATLWGANAVNGVINVITASASATRGGLAYAGGGNEERAFAGVRWGGPLGRGAYRVFAQYDDHDALALPAGGSAEDPFRIGHAGFRADVPGLGGDLTLQADVYDGRIGHRLFDDSEVDGGDLQGRWRRTTAGGSQLEVRWFYDHTFRRVPGQFREDRDTGDVEAQQRWVHGRHDLLWGVGYRLSRDQVGNSAVLAFVPPEATEHVGSLFAQDQVRLGERWRLLGGLRLEDQSTMDTQLLPALTLAYDASSAVTLWAGAGRAVRAPTRIDRDVRVPGAGPPFVVGNPDFRPETLIAYELGSRAALGAAWLLEMSVYYNDYDHIRSTEPGPTGLPLVVGNGLLARTKGFALTATYDPSSWAQIQLHETWLDSDVWLRPGSHDVSGGANEANDPDHFGFLRVSLDLPYELQLDGTLREVGRIDVAPVPAYTELDLRLARRVRAVELAIVGQNLLHGQHPEIGPVATREDVQRGVYGQVTWNF